MKWPWMTRAAHVAVRDAYETIHASDQRYIALIEAQLDESHTRYDKLAARYDKAIMRVVGPDPVPSVPKREDPVANAIVAKSRNSPILRKQLSDYAHIARTHGVEESQIAADILAGDEYLGGIHG